MTRPEFYGIRSGLGVVHLCRCCTAVLACEGRVAGDPMGPSIDAAEVTEMWPLEDDVAAMVHAKCAACESLRRFEEKRALLAAPPRRIGEVVQ